MHERLNSGIKFCIIGNLLFLAFSIVCFIFYTTYEAGSALSTILEYIAYATEFSGFAAFIFGDWLISSSIRFRGLMKICIMTS